MDLIDRYVRAACIRLRGRRRRIAERELRETILKKLERVKKGSEATGEEIEAVLKEMGDPAAAASGYGAEGAFPFPPVFSGIFKNIFRIVFCAVLLGILFYFMFYNVPSGGSWWYFPALLTEVIVSFISAYIVLSVIFRIIGRIASKYVTAGPDQEWDPAELRSSRYFRLENITRSILHMMIILAATVLFNFLTDKIGIFYSWGRFAPLLDASALRAVLPFWNIFWALAFIYYLALLVVGEETKPLRIYGLALPVLSIAIAAVMLLSPSIISGALPSRMSGAPADYKSIFDAAYWIALCLVLAGSAALLAKRILRLKRPLR
jgi:hypothetical protein